MNNKIFFKYRDENRGEQ